MIIFADTFFTEHLSNNLKFADTKYDIYIIQCPEEHSGLEAESWL